MVMNSINMRSSKMKFLIYGCVVCGMLSTIYLLSTTHNRLKNVKGAYDTCMQQKDSLLAQLQVVYEQKSRVEKSLQKEKSDHAKTKEDYQEINQFKLVLEREKQNSEGKYNTLQQEHQTLQDKFTQLTSDSSQLTEKLNQLEENFHKYQAEAEKLAQSKENEVKKLNGDMSALILSKEQLSINYKKSEKNLQLLTEKLRSIQAANSLQQDQGASKPEAIQQNHPEGEETINNSDKVSPKKPQETNLNASPTESNKVQSQVRKPVSPNKLATAGVVYANDHISAMSYQNPHSNFNGNNILPPYHAQPHLPLQNNVRQQVPPPWHPQDDNNNNGISHHEAPVPIPHPISPPFNQDNNEPSWDNRFPLQYQQPHQDIFDKNKFMRNLERSLEGHKAINMMPNDSFHKKLLLKNKGLRINDVEGGNSIGMEIHDKAHKSQIVPPDHEDRNNADEEWEQNENDNRNIQMIRGHIVNN